MLATESVHTPLGQGNTQAQGGFSREVHRPISRHTAHHARIQVGNEARKGVLLLHPPARLPPSVPHVEAPAILAWRDRYKFVESDDDRCAAANGQDGE